MVVDSSALLAIIQKEPECEPFLAVIRSAERVYVSTVTMLETGTVLHARRGEAGTTDLSGFVEGMGIEIIPFDDAQRELAMNAFASYGKGIHPRARLNLGDCVVYALAKAVGAPLLFKGNDFAATDIPVANT